MIKYLSKFLYILPAQNSSLIVLLLFFLFVSLLETFGIGLIGPFVNLASKPDSIHQNSWLNWVYVQSGLQNETYLIAALGLLIIILFCIKSVVSWHVQTYIFVYSARQKVALIGNLMNSYLTAPYAFHLSKSSSQIIHNVINETGRFTNVLSTLLTSTSNLVIILCLSVLLCSTSPLALLSLLFIILPLFLLLSHFKQRIGLWGKQMSQANEAIIRNVNHGLGGLKETRVIGCEAYFEEKIHEQAAITERASASFYGFKLSPRIIVETLLVVFLVGFISIFLIYKGNIEDLTAILSIFTLASIRLIPALTNITNGLGLLRRNSYAMNKLYLDLKELRELTDEAGKIQTSKYISGSVSKNKHLSNSGDKVDSSIFSFKEQLCLEQVTYSYPNAPEVALDSISLTIKKGQSIAFIGKSGAGKTTLVDVLLGLLRPESGDIQSDNVSIYTNLRAWQNLIGYIPQSIFLTEDSIERNIAFGIPDHLIDHQRLDKAIRSAQLSELVEELPNGIQTFVGERGVRLSGGQRQRIGIARALYHEREILVMDEATAALDNETESLVTEAIKSLSGKKTMIIIAHRLSTVEHCDIVYEMDKGRIVKSGSYQEIVLAR